MHICSISAYTLINKFFHDTYPWDTSAECVTVGLITGDCVLVAEMGATTVGSTAVEVVTAGRDCGQRERTLLHTKCSTHNIPSLLY